MCELMALSCSEPIVARRALEAFGPRSVENPDGWGIAWYTDQAASLIKEPIAWKDSELAGYLSTTATVQALTLLAHVRHKTVGSDHPGRADTHPFVRESLGKEYAFAHNGTLKGLTSDFPRGRFAPLGQTDSERFFCHLLSRIEAEQKPLNAASTYGWLHQVLSHANKRGKLNMLLSDGRFLAVYHDENGWKGLHFRSISVDFEREIVLNGPISESKIAASMVATVPLRSPDQWEPIQLGELLIFESGRLVWSSHRSPTNP